MYGKILRAIHFIRICVSFRKAECIKDKKKVIEQGASPDVSSIPVYFAYAVFLSVMMMFAPIHAQAAPGTITTVAGGGPSWIVGDGGAATSASLRSPVGVSVDGAGNIYIADSMGNRIRKVDAATGIISTIAGTGVAGFSGDGGTAILAQLNGPLGVSVDSVGNIYISGFGNRIRKVDVATGIISTIAGTGVFGFSGDGGAAILAQFTSSGVSVDSAGNVYIADANNDRVLKVDAATSILSTVAGTGVVGFSGDGGAATLALLRRPIGVSVDSVGNIYIADLNDHRIRKVDAATGIISTVAGTGVAGFSGDGGAATSAQLDLPRGVSVDNAGNIYIAELLNNRIRKVDVATGIISTIAGTGVAGFSGDGGAATSAQLKNPFGVSVDSAGNVYIADSNNHRIRKVEAIPAGSNQPPLANAGVSQTVESTGATTAVSLNGSASSDPNGDPLTYAWTWAGGSATGVTPTVNLANGTYTITLTVNDGNGGSNSANTSVTVQDTIAPIISIAPIPVAEATSASGAVVNVLPYVTAMDVCAVSLGVAPAGTYPLGTTSVTVSATDCVGNSSTATAIVIVQDTTPPTLTVPANVTASATGVQTSVAIGTATATDIFAASVSNNAPATFPVGATTITYTATDGNGLMSTGLQTVLVTEVTNASALLPGGGTVTLAVPAGHTLFNVGAGPAFGAPAGFTFPFGFISYNVTTPVGGTVTTTMTFSNGLPAIPMVWKFTGFSYQPLPAAQWSVTGPNSLAITLTDGGPFDLDGTANGIVIDPVVVGFDSTPPQINLLGANPMTVAQGSVFTDPGSTVTDNVDTGLVASVAGTVNTAVVGTYTLTYNVSDVAGNAAVALTRTVIVADQTAPTIALTGANPLTIAQGSVFTDPGSTVTDNVDAGLVASVAGTVNTAVVGTYMLTYNVSDVAGNPAVALTRTVIVADQTAPTIALTGANPMTVAQGSVFTDPGSTVTDNVDTGLVASVTGAVNTAVVGTYTLTYNVSDAAGNPAATVTRTVKVKSNNVVSNLPLPGGNTVTIAVPAGQTLSNVTAAPAFGGPPGVVFPFGSLSYTATVPMGQVNVTTVVTLNAPLGPGMVLYKYNPTPPAGMPAFSLVPQSPIGSEGWRVTGPNSFSLTLTDGGIFDLDGVVNGVVVDPVALGVPMTPAQISTIPVATILAWTPTAIATLSPMQVAAMTPLQIATLIPAQLGGIVASFTPVQVASLTAVQLTALMPIHLASLLPSLTPAQITALTPAQIAALTPLQLGALLPSLTPPQIVAFTPVQIAALSPVQIASVIGAFTPAQAALLMPAQVAALTAAQIAALSPQVVAVLNPLLGNEAEISDEDKDEEASDEHDEENDADSKDENDEESDKDD